MYERVNPAHPDKLADRRRQGGFEKFAEWGLIR